MLKEYYLSILSGQQVGLIASLFKSILTAFTYPYSTVLHTRNILYKRSIVKSTRLPVKVISIGNITTGGTGKTPLVEFLARYLHRGGKKTAILSRGYGGNHASQNYSDIANDECMTLRENLPEVPVLVGGDRVSNGEKAIRDYGADCLILDDGFQHFRLKRDLDIVVIDSLNPFGGDNLIPRGSLREPLKSLERVDLFVISHGDQSTEQTLKSTYSRLRQLNPHAPVCESIHRPVLIENVAGSSTQEPEWLKGKKIYALSAIGNPVSFAFTLKRLGAHLIKHNVFPDHHVYTKKEIEDVVAEASALIADAIVVTQKDMVKIRNMDIKDNILSLKIEMEITKGIHDFTEAVDSVVNLDQND